MYKKLLGNSVIFAIGNLGSKLISILLVPLYTYYLTTSDYGMVDIVTTTSNMLLPIISLSVYEGVLRFVMDKNEETDVVITNGFIITVIGVFFLLLMYPILISLNISNSLLKYMFIILVLKAVQTLFSQITRAIGKIKLYALNGILMTIITGTMNIWLLVYLKTGIDGYLLSIVFTNLFSIIFLLCAAKIYQYFNVSKINILLIKRLLSYCIPLIPNAFMWWIINASNRYFILYFVGAGANGLFAVANKIPSLLSILNTIFFQAWQLSAIEEYDSKTKSHFYSEVFTYFSMVMFIGTSGIIVVLKHIMKFAISPDFYDAWKLVPFLLIGVVFSSFSGFLGTNYIAAKETKGVFKTSVIGGVVNVVANFVLIPLIGVNGAGLATMISFFVMWILRIFDTRKFIDIEIHLKNIIINLLVLSIQILILHLNLNIILESTIEIGLFIILLLNNKNLFIPIKKVLYSVMKK